MRKPGISLPWWKALLGGGYLFLFFTSAIWLFNSILQGTWYRRPSFVELMLGFPVFPLFLWTWWTSNANKPHSRWLSNLCLCGYLILLLMAGAIGFLCRSLSPPWGQFAAGLQGLLAIALGTLALVSLRRASILFEKIANRMWIIAALLGGGGAGGALIGMYAARHGKVGSLHLLLGIVFSVLALTLLLGSATSLWPYRPWQKEDDEDEPLDDPGRHPRRLVRHVAVATPQPALRATGLKDWWRKRQARAALRRGTRLAMEGKQPQAIARLTKAIELEPQNAEAHMSRGNAYLESGQTEQALQDFHQAIRLDPAQPLAYYNRALAWLEKGDEGQALADLSEAIRLDPQDAESYNLRGIVYSRRGEHERALADVERVIELGEVPRGYVNKAVMLERKGDLAGAGECSGPVLPRTVVGAAWGSGESACRPEAGVEA